jgi:hypothetical protein
MGAYPNPKAKDHNPIIAPCMAAKKRSLKSSSGSIAQHVVIIVLQFTGRSDASGALEDQFLLAHGSVVIWDFFKLVSRGRTIHGRSNNNARL